MTTPEAHDDELFAELAQAMRGLGDPPSEGELAAARPARDRVGATDPWDLAELASDSLFDQPATVRRADLAGARALVFYADELTLQLSVTADLLTARVDPAARSLTLITRAGERLPFTELGGDGFELADPPSGAVRLECASPAGLVATEWFRL